jgi:hypothetical protein
MIRFIKNSPALGSLFRVPAMVALLAAAAMLNGPALAQSLVPGNGNSTALNARDAQGATPLVAAAQSGSAESVRSLLAAGADVNATAADGRTPLIAAAQSGNVEVVRMLISAGAALNAATRGTGTAVEAAERSGNKQVAALLLAAGARSSGESVGDTVCVLPWGGEGFCGKVQDFTIRAVQLQVSKVVGCAGGCSERKECSASRPVGGSGGIHAGEEITVPSWCLTQTGVKP